MMPHPEPVPFCMLGRHCAGYAEFDPQMNAIVYERICQLAAEGKIIITDDSPEQDDIYAPVSLPNTRDDRRRAADSAQPNGA